MYWYVLYYQKKFGREIRTWGRDMAENVRGSFRRARKTAKNDFFRILDPCMLKTAPNRAQEVSYES